MLYIKEKERTTIFKNMDDSHKHDIEQMKLDTEEHIFYLSKENYSIE